jgi:hypothetical protein
LPGKGEAVVSAGQQQGLLLPLLQDKALRPLPAARLLLRRVVRAEVAVPRGRPVPEAQRPSISPDTGFPSSLRIGLNACRRIHRGRVL